MSSWLEHILVVLLVYAWLRILWKQHQQAAKKRKKQGKWLVSDLLLYGQLIKQRNKRKYDGQSFTFTRMMWGRYTHLFRLLREVGFWGTIQTAFIERLNLTSRHFTSARLTFPLKDPQMN